MRVILELIRIFLVFFLLSGIFSWLLLGAYDLLNVKMAEEYEWMGFVAVLLGIFVLYRNKLQFSGWYKGEEVKKLPKKVTILLLSVSGLLVILLPIFSHFKA